MRYLLEVLESDRERYSDLHQVYAFAPCEPGNEALVTALWKAKGVEPILYRPRENDHSPLYDSLREWRRYAGDATAWRREQLRPILNGASKDQTPETLARCVSLLGHGDASKLLAELSPAPDWMAPLADRQVFGVDKARPGEWIASCLNSAEMIRACVQLPMLDDQSIWHIEREIEKVRGDLSVVRLKAWHLILKSKRPGSPQEMRGRIVVSCGAVYSPRRSGTRQSTNCQRDVAASIESGEGNAAYSGDMNDQTNEPLERLLKIDFGRVQPSTQSKYCGSKASER